MERNQKQAIEICYSYSGLEVVDKTASIYRESFTDSELKQLLDFYNSDLGQKDIRVAIKAGEIIQSELGARQSETLEKETLHFNEETERLYLKYLEENCGWLERNFYKAFSK